MSKKALLVSRVSGFVPQFEMNNVKILQEMGYEIHYAANYNTVVYGEDNARLMGTGIVRHSIPFGRKVFSLDVWRCYKKLVELMLEEEFSLVHCHMPISGVLARKAAERVRKITGRRVPVIYTAHGFHFFYGAPAKNWLYYPPERHYARYTDRLLLINEEDFDRGSRFPVRGRTEHVPGVGLAPAPEVSSDFDLRRAYGISPEDKVVVSVGELTPLKNHITMIKAMDRFRREPVSYLICGRGPLEEELSREIREMHLEGKVILAGYCQNVPAILRQADIFAFPSKREGLPVAMMEAMQAGLPVLAADVRGNRDLLEDGQGGFLFEENLARDYVRALHYLLKYPEERIRMGKWNKERVKDFSLEIVDKKMREIYREVEQEAGI
ncbi:MAG: glycosyltransferase [Lachnospiraceae bacterium]|nr:glycosyltransferase [Lachnospiraceae bacterium]